MTSLIFGPLIDPFFLSLINQPSKHPSSYTSEWVFRNFWDDYLENEHEEKRSPKLNDEDSVDSDDERKIKSDPVALFFYKMKNHKSIQLNDLKNIFKTDVFKYENEHKRLSKALGVLTKENIDNPQEYLNKTPLFYAKIIKYDWENIKNMLIINEFEKNKLVANPIREVFLSFFTVFYM